MPKTYSDYGIQSPLIFLDLPSALLSNKGALT